MVKKLKFNTYTDSITQRVGTCVSNFNSNCKFTSNFNVALDEKQGKKQLTIRKHYLLLLLV